MLYMPTSWKGNHAGACTPVRAGSARRLAQFESLDLAGVRVLTRSHARDLGIEDALKGRRGIAVAHPHRRVGAALRKHAGLAVQDCVCKRWQVEEDVHVLGGFILRIMRAC